VRRPALLANLGVVIGLLPWLPGLINDFTSPTVKILSALSPFTVHDVRIALGHWAVGYPYANSVPLSQLPGTLSLVMLACAPIVAISALAARRDRGPGTGVASGGGWPRIGRDQRVVLILALAVCTPVGEALASAVSTHIFGVRNLAASWPALALSFAALLTAPRRRVAMVAAGLAVAAFAIAAVRMLDGAYQRPDYRAAGNLIAHDSRGIGVVIDETGNISPGPLTPFDLTLHTQVRVFRALAPAERSHPYGFLDPTVGLPQATRQAVAAARGGPIAIVSTLAPASDIVKLQQRIAPQTAHLPPPYVLVEDHVYPGIARVEVKVYASRTR
jgi:hypothetical protein